MKRYVSSFALVRARCVYSATLLYLPWYSPFSSSLFLSSTRVWRSSSLNESVRQSETGSSRRILTRSTCLFFRRLSKNRGNFVRSFEGNSKTNSKRFISSKRTSFKRVIYWFKKFPLVNTLLDFLKKKEKTVKNNAAKEEEEDMDIYTTLRSPLANVIELLRELINWSQQTELTTRHLDGTQRWSTNGELTRYHQR